MNFLTKQKETHRLREWTHGCWGGGKEEGKGKFGSDMYTLLYLKWITNKDLLWTLLQWTVNSATMNSELCSMLWRPGWEASLGESGCMSTCGWVPSPYLKLSQPCLSTGYAPIQNKKFKKQKIKHKLSTWRLWIYFLSPQFTFVGWIAASHLYSQWQLNQQRWGLGTW